MLPFSRLYKLAQTIVAFGIAQLAQSLDLNLADVLAGELELGTHLVQGVIMTILRSPTRLDDDALTE